MRKVSGSLKNGGSRPVRDAVGRCLCVNGIDFRILGAEPCHPDEVRRNPSLGPVLDLKPGSVFCPNNRRATEIVLACASNRKNRGGAVILTSILTSDGERHNGAYRVAQALGLEPGAAVTP